MRHPPSAVPALAIASVEASARPGPGGGAEAAPVTAWFCALSATALALAATCAWLSGGDVDVLDGRALIDVRRVAGTAPIGAAADQLMLSATALGALATLTIVLIAAGGCLTVLNRRAAAVRLVVEAGVGMGIADLLKHLVGRPRPTVVAHWAEVGGSSFPSGHSADSAIVYFLLAALVIDQFGRTRATRYLQGVAAALVVLVGISRVYLGVHYPTDVLAGWTLGTFWVWLCRQSRDRRHRPSFMHPSTFHDVVVHPTQRLLEQPLLLFQGGPDWPLFWLRRHPRHCWFATAVPLDLRPRRIGAAVVRREAQGAWCGPLTPHFGHAVTTFGGRIAASSLLPSYVPLVFSAQPDEEAPVFLWQMLAHFGVAPERVRIVSSPAVFDTLSVLPQAERLLGGAPAPAYLDLLDALSGPPPPLDGGGVYVSRAGMWKGKIAGESYLEAIFERSGYRVLRPESIPVEEQLATYRRAARLVFAEGSAMHGLQLLGRIGAEVAVIVRRPGARLARPELSARVPALSYIDAARGLIRGVGRSGRRQPSAGLTIVDPIALVAGLAAIGVPAATSWDEAEFRRHEADDLKVWLDARARVPTHPSDPAAIARSLRRCQRLASCAAAS